MADLTTEYGEPVVQRSRIGRWFADRPRVADVLAIVVCVAPTLAQLVVVRPPHLWFALLCLAGIGVTLWWRRAFPLTASLLVVGLGALGAIGPGTCVTLVVAYTLAVSLRLRTALLGVLLGGVVVMGAGNLSILLGMRPEWPVGLVQPLGLVAFVLGLAVRSSRLRRCAQEALVREREERAAAAERARIAAEMHDVVAHSVTVMVALAGGAAAGWEKHPERSRAALAQLGAVGADTLGEMQRILRLLHDGEPGPSGAPPGAGDPRLGGSGHDAPDPAAVVAVFVAAGLPVELRGDHDLSDLDPVLRTTVIRILQEALTNALRHARAPGNVAVEVERAAARITVTVTDTGQGPPPAESVGTGLGLRAMRERAAAFGGEFAAGPTPGRGGAPGRGWRVRVSLPLAESRAGSGAGVGAGVGAGAGAGAGVTAAPTTTSTPGEPA